MQFIPDGVKQGIEIPYFEDSTKSKVAGAYTTKSKDALMKEVREVLTQLGAFGISITPGKYVGTPTRYGFMIAFQWEGQRGRIDIAALPIRSETPTRKDAALRQALYLFRDRLIADLNAVYYEPGGAMPLLPYLLGAGNQTVKEAMIEIGRLPVMPGGNVIMLGDGKGK